MKRKNKVKPTKLQKKTLEIIMENPQRWAKRGGKKAIMIEGGYSPKTGSHPKQKLVVRKGVAIALEDWREYLRGSGLGEEKLQQKYQEWVDAVKIKSSMTEPDKVVPDYETQLKVKDDIRRDLGLPIEKGAIIAQQFNIGGKMELEFIGKDEK